MLVTVVVWSLIVACGAGILYGLFWMLFHSDRAQRPRTTFWLGVMALAWIVLLGIEFVTDQSPTGWALYAGLTAMGVIIFSMVMAGGAAINE